MLDVAKRMRERTEDAQPPHFERGAYVLVRIAARKSLEPRYFGPYRVKRAGLWHTFVLEDLQGKEHPTHIHVDRLKQYNIDPKNPPSEQQEFDNSDVLVEEQERLFQEAKNLG